MNQDFQSRINKLSEKHGQTVSHQPTRRAAPKRAIGPIAVIFYSLWGLAFGVTLDFVNTNYDRFVLQREGDTDLESLYLGLVSFLAITLVLMALSLLIALGRTLLGRRSAPNWLRIVVFLIGISVSSFATALQSGGL